MDYIEIADIEAETPAVEVMHATPYDNPTATWTYWTALDSAEAGIPDEWVWERLRYRRDQLLAQSDFRMVTDAPWDRAPWESYRQALRELPANTTDPREAVWPEPPA